jgi:hypothetical protein
MRPMCREDEALHAERTARHSSLASAGDHEQAVLRAEVQRLVTALSPYGVLSRDALRREAGALHWHEPLFDRALETAVAGGQIAELPLGFYGLRR